MEREDLKTQLFAFLAGDEVEFRTIGRTLSREDARELLCELIPAEIQVRGVCTLSQAVVVAAPHVSFDNWSEYFCNRVARKYRTGWVVAKNFRDLHPHTIPVSIGRHLHVNRPTESVRPGGAEQTTDRARQTHQDYLAALTQASGRSVLPLDALIEFHSQQRTPDFEIATTGVNSELAELLVNCYEKIRLQEERLPELRIEPLHEVMFKAESTKQIGSMRLEVTRCALHIEIPREMRRTDPDRSLACKAMLALTEGLLEQLQNKPSSSF